MKENHFEPIKKSPRIEKLVEELFAKMPEVEADRAVLITESYEKTKSQPVVTRRAKAFCHILENIPITIRAHELVVGSATLAPRGSQVFPEFSYQWLLDELDTIETRSADPFYVSQQTQDTLRRVLPGWHTHVFLLDRPGRCGILVGE